MVFFQFMDDDFEHGMQTKREIEKLFDLVQIIVYVIIILTLLITCCTKWTYRYIVFLCFLLLWLTRFFNPISTNYRLYKAQKQSIFGGGPTDDEDDIESFDV